MGGKKKEGDADKGKGIFMTQCASCHNLTTAGTGPPLGGVYGGSIAANGGFAYR